MVKRKAKKQKAKPLYLIEVQFTGTPYRTYTYKSWELFMANDNAVVESPSSGLTVVKVVSCRKAEDPIAASSSYKWIVSKVDKKTYDEKVGPDLEAENRKLRTDLVKLRMLLTKIHRASGYALEMTKGE